MSLRIYKFNNIHKYKCKNYFDSDNCINWNSLSIFILQNYKILLSIAGVFSIHFNDFIPHHAEGKLWGSLMPCIQILGSILSIVHWLEHRLLLWSGRECLASVKDAGTQCWSEWDILFDPWFLPFLATTTMHSSITNFLSLLPPQCTHQ